jgi:acyl carrier protein
VKFAEAFTSAPLPEGNRRKPLAPVVHNPGSMGVTGGPPSPDRAMDTKTQLLSLLDETLNLQRRTESFTDDTRLLGSLPELDSMGVVALLTAFETRFGFSVDDDEIDGQVFETVGTLLQFVRSKLDAMR